LSVNSSSKPITNSQKNHNGNLIDSTASSIDNELNSTTNEIISTKNKKINLEIDKNILNYKLSNSMSDRNLKAFIKNKNKYNVS
jgi:competence protein ComGF